MNFKDYSYIYYYKFGYYYINHIKNKDIVLTRACFYGHIHIVKLMLKNGVVDSYSWGIIFANRNGYHNIVKLLRKYK